MKLATLISFYARLPNINFTDANVGALDVLSSKGPTSTVFCCERGSARLVVLQDLSVTDDLTGSAGRVLSAERSAQQESVVSNMRS